MKRIAGQREHWGMVGHYTIAGAACQLGPAGTKLAQLLRDNRDRVAISDIEIVAGNRYEPGQRGAFVALADVPDLVWRRTRPEDAANHFADMDQPGGAAAGGQTLMALWHSGNGTWRTPAGWTAFYDSLTPPPADEHRGALPFRAAQLYGLMVDAVRGDDVLRYVATAGVLAHYVGDGCQPLHVSRLHHGVPGAGEDAVHSVYETTMLDEHAAEVVAGVNADLADDPHGPPLVTGSDEAADAAVALMQRTIEAIPPADIVSVFAAHPGPDQTTQLWNAFGAATVKRLADGAKTLAMLWTAAWRQGGGETIDAAKIQPQPKPALAKPLQHRHFRSQRVAQGLEYPAPPLDLGRDNPCHSSGHDALRNFARRASQRGLACHDVGVAVSTGVGGEGFLGVEELFQGFAIVWIQCISIDGAAGFQAGEAAASFDDVAITHCRASTVLIRIDDAQTAMSGSGIPTRVQASSTPR